MLFAYLASFSLGVVTPVLIFLCISCLFLFVRGFALHGSMPEFVHLYVDVHLDDLQLGTFTNKVIMGLHVGRQDCAQVPACIYSV